MKFSFPGTRLRKRSRITFMRAITEKGFIYISPCLAHFDFRAAFTALRLRDFAASLLGLGR